MTRYKLNAVSYLIRDNMEDFLELYKQNPFHEVKASRIIYNKVSAGMVKSKLKEVFDWRNNRNTWGTGVVL